MIDLTNLSPAPWWQNNEGAVRCDSVFVCQCGDLESRKANAAFIAAARNAFDVMMRRGWHAERGGGEWWVVYESGILLLCRVENPGKGETYHYPDAHTDPFTALVEADKWWADSEGGPQG